MAGKGLGQRKQPRTFGEWLDQTIESCEERIERGELTAPTAIAMQASELVTLRMVRTAVNNYGVETTRPFGKD